MRSLDRRVIYLLALLVVVVPLLSPFGLPLAISPEVKQAYDALLALPPGTRVLVSVDYDPATAELAPLAEAVLSVLATRDAKVVTITSYPESVSLPEEATQNTYERTGKVYGSDYVNLGYYAGLEASLVAFCDNVRDVFKTDCRGNTLDTLPLMTQVKSIDDFDLVVTLNASAGIGTTVEMWVRQINVSRGKPLIAGVTGVMSATTMPYLQSGNLEGLMVGLKAAAEIEKASDTPGAALAAMDALTLADVLMLVLLVLGNVSYVIERRSGKGSPVGGGATR
jgi:hypothetical protein